MIKPISLLFTALVTLIPGAHAGSVSENVKLYSTGAGISFTENKGQVADQNHAPRPDVLYGGTDGKLVYHLRTNGISYQLSRVDSWVEEKKDFTLKNRTEKQIGQSTTSRLDINWRNSSPARVATGATLEGSTNYYLAHCPSGALNVRSYADVTYQSLYPGIDLKWYQKDGHLKYDYYVAAGADYQKIQLEINGAENIKLNNKGELVLKTALGDVIEQAPVVRQNGRTLKSAWSIKNNIISYVIEGIDATKSFVIDPVVRAWGTYYSGAADDHITFINSNASGDVFAGGYTDGSTGISIATTGAYQTTFAGGNNDAFIVKFNAAGARQWATLYGGSATDVATACCTDGSGNLFISGMTNSNAGISTPGSHQPARTAGDEHFLVKFDASGTRLWATYYGGAGNEGYTAYCATDVSGNVYLAGSTTSASGNISTAGSHQPTSGGGTDAYLAKFDASGVRQWATYYGGTASDFGMCKVDGSGNVYLVGNTYSSGGTGIATPGSFQPAFGGGSNGDGFVAKFNSAGIRQWGTYYGGAETEGVLGVAVDSPGNVYFSGYITGATSTNVASPGSHQPAYGGGSCDGFLVKMDNTGMRLWATYYGGMDYDDAEGCAVDGNGNVFVIGYTTSFTGTAVATPGSYQSTQAGIYDACLAKFDANGVRQWGTYYGGADDDRGLACVADASGNVYIAGSTKTSAGTAIASPGSYQPVFSAGYYSGFVAKLTDCVTPANPVNATSAANQTLCATLQATLSATTPTGNISWYSAATGGTAISTGTTLVTPTLSAGTYTYYAEGMTCVPSVSRTAVTITVNALPLISVNSGSICSGNSFTISPSGANTYTYSGGSNVVTPAATSSYSVTGTSTAGCVSSNTAVSTVTVYITPTITVNSGSVCSGQSFTLVPGGASTYTFSGGSAVVTPTSTTNYSVMGTSTANCISASPAISTITFNNNTPPVVSVNSGSICNGQSFTVVPSGASTYTINGGSNFTVSPAATTNYSVSGTSTAGCVSSAMAILTVSVYARPVVSVNSGSICNGQSFTVVPSGAFTYSINGGSNFTVSPGTTTSYSITGASTAGCLSSNTATATVTVYTLPVISAGSGAICAGKSFTIVPSGAATYSTNGIANNLTVTPSATTDYSVTGTSASGCVSSNTAIVTVTVNQLPVISVNSGSVCAGQSFTIIPSGAATYTVNGGSNFTVSPAATTSYSVTGTSTAGCISAAAAVSTVAVIALPVITVNSGSVCAGNNFTILPSGASTYTVSGGSFTVNPSVTTSYSVTGTSSAGCVSTLSAVSNVTVNALPVVTVNSGTICSGQSFIIVPAGAASYSVIGASTIVTPSASTDYSVTGTGIDGCSSATLAISHVTVNSLPVLIIVNSNSVICNGETTQLSISGAQSYTWSTGENTASVSVTPSVTNMYTVTGTNVTGCFATAVVTQSVDACLGINKTAKSVSLLVYPNPNNGLFTIDSELPVSIRIVNMLGQLVIETHLLQGKNKLDLSQHANGIYMLSIKESAGTVIKIVKE